MALSRSTAYCTRPLAFCQVRTFCQPQPSQGSEDPTEAKKLLSASQRRSLLERVIRVDHAGELGADRIYAGQHFVLRNTRSGPLVKHMWDQEKEHLRTFERLIAKHNVRPTILAPAWNIAGFVLGAGTAILGKEAAMACTVAVEETIVQHYDGQLRDLIEDDPEVHANLLKTIKKCRDEELEHHDIGLENDAQKTPLFHALKFVIQTGCKGAIWMSERV